MDCVCHLERVKVLAWESSLISGHYQLTSASFGWRWNGKGIMSDYPLEYIFEQLDRGFDLEFIAKDSGVQLDSLTRRLDRARKADKLKHRHIVILDRFLGRIE